MKRSLFFMFVCAVFLSAHTADAGTIKSPPSNNGLVGYWSFNEGTSTRATDFSGNGNTGTLTNMDAATDWVAGKLGKALDFDGTNDYVDMGTGHNVYQQSTPFSGAAWVKTTTTNERMIVAKWATLSSGGWQFFMDDFQPGKIAFLMTNSAGTSLRRVVGSTNVNDGNWHHVAWTYSGNSAASGIRLYVDGRAETTTVVNDTNPGTLADTALRVGQRSGSLSPYFSGSIDDVRIYNRALSAAEIQTLYSSGATTRRQVSQNGLVGHWRFDEGTSTRAVDHSGSGNTGTLTNMEPVTDWVNGKLGKALDFDGVNEHLVLQDSTLPSGTSARTISLWLKIDSASGQRSIANWGENSLGQRFGIWFDSNGLGIESAGAGYQFPFNDTSAWHHFVATMPAGASINQLSLYLDGVAQSATLYGSNTAINTNTAGSALFAIGILNLSGLYPFDGKIDDVRIYNRALSAVEVQTLYSSGATTRRQVSQNGLVGHWRFDEGTSTRATDFSGNGNTGTLTNMDAATDWVAGKLGKALDFDGTNDYIGGYGDVLDMSTNDMTISLWVKATTLAATDNHLVTKSRAGGGQGRYAMYLNANGRVGILLEVDGGLVYYGAVGATSVNDGRWHNITGVFDRDSNFTVYIDGRNDGATSIAAGNGANLNSAYYFLIGAYGDATGLGGIAAGSYFRGNIDDIRIYNRALSVAEVQTLYDLGR